MQNQSPSKTFGLKWPRDLLAKLRYDIERLRCARSSDDAKYAAFDCAVDAWHMTDWVLAAVDSERHHQLCGEVRLAPQAAVRFAEQQAERLPILKYCREIANGVKHFELRPKYRMDNVSTNSTVTFQMRVGPDFHVDSMAPICQLIIDGVRYNALEFFEDAHEQWLDFLKEERLSARAALNATFRKRDAST